MALVPGATFTMGIWPGSLGIAAYVANEDDDDEFQHQVTLDAFCLDVVPVTVGAYARCSTCVPPDTGQRFCNQVGKGKDDHPQNCVSWYEAAAYCGALGNRLPTEAEFEYAAGGGLPRGSWKQPDGCVGRLGVYDAKGTCPVGSYPATAFGLRDMVGNVWEWVGDWDGPYPSTPQTNPVGPPSPSPAVGFRSMRGGAWNRGGVDEFIIRGRHPPDSRYDDVGFRCARAVQRKRMGASAAAAPPAAPAPAAPPVPVPSTAPSGGCPFNMVEVPGGTFTMGAKDGRDDERPVHQVTLDAFCLDVAPVTVAAYARCSTCAPRKKNPDCNESGKGKDDHPQNCVSWDEAAAYCKAQGKKLPTEAQFEYAARGGAENREWSLGSAPTRTTACVDRMGGPDDFGTCPAGAHPAGAFGLSDMAGNVWEWMADWYALYPSAPQKNPTGPSSPGMNSLRVLRGGAWTNVRGDELRSHLRGDGYADFHGGADIGFRCAKERGTR